MVAVLSNPHQHNGITSLCIKPQSRGLLPERARPDRTVQPNSWHRRGHVTGQGRRRRGGAVKGPAPRTMLIEDCPQTRGAIYAVRVSDVIP